MDKQEQIKKIENEIEELKQEVEKLKNENKGRWIPEKEEKYYFIDNYNNLNIFSWDNDSIDKKTIEKYRIFKTEKEARRYQDYLKALKEATYEFTNEEWNNSEIDKWSIYCNYVYGVISCGLNYNWRNIGQKFFKTKEEAKAFVSKWEKEIKEYEFGIYEEE